MDFETFVEQRKDDAIDEILYGDYQLLSDAIIDATADNDIMFESAIDALAVGITAFLARRDPDVPESKVNELEAFFDKVAMDLPFFDSLVEFKLNQMWDRGV